MARTKMGGMAMRRRSPPPPPRRRILVVSLPTAVDRKETTAEPAPGATTRARGRRLAAAAAALPEDILAWEIFVRLPAKDVLRCRAVCRSWRRLTSAPDFLLAHHGRQPSLPLLTLFGAESTNNDGLPLPIIKHGRPLLGLDDYAGFKLHASCDGLLLFSLTDGRFSICNPITRQRAPLSCLTAAGQINIVALYLHSPSGEYRVLYWKGRQHYHPKAAYYILTVRRRRSPRRIGVPSYIPSMEEVTVSWHDGRTTPNSAPPVVHRNCLHWDTGRDAGILVLVFDTVLESFRLMRRPASATRLCTCLCDMEGSIGFSCYGHGGRGIVKIWVLEDYDREVWSFKYHVELHVESFYRQHFVLSHKGDLLVCVPSSGYMFHCDSNGKLLEEFQCDSWDLSIVGHRFKESLVKHHVSMRRASDRVFRMV